MGELPIQLFYPIILLMHWFSILGYNFYVMFLSRTAQEVQPYA